MKKIITFFIIIIGLFLLLFYTDNFTKIPFLNNSTTASVGHHIGMIDINVGSATTKIIPENRNDLHASLDGKGKVNVKHHGDKITVTMKKKWFSGIFSLFNKSNLTIYIPEDYHRNMDINIGSGNLSFEGMSKSDPVTLNELSVQVGSGNVHLKNIKTDQYKHHGSSGNLTIDTLATATGSFDISSGNVNLRHYNGKLKAHLSSGTFKAQLEKLTDDININASSGSIKLDLPRDSDFTLNGNTSSGSITSKTILKNVTKTQHHVKGTYGSGKHKIDLNVSSGNIDIY